jgi:hypothetical protein
MRAEGRAMVKSGTELTHEFRRSIYTKSFWFLGWFQNKESWGGKLARLSFPKTLIVT